MSRSASGLRCERCGTRRALWATLDEPEQEGAAFGDETLAMCLCTGCLDASEADGPWNLVVRIDPRRAAA